MTAPKDMKTGKPTSVSPPHFAATASGAANVVHAPMARSVPVTIAANPGEKAETSRKRAGAGDGAKKASKKSGSTTPAFDVFAPFGGAFAAQFSDFKMPDFTSFAVKLPEFPFPSFTSAMPKFDKMFGFAGSEGIAEQNAENLKAIIAANTAFLRMVDALAKGMLSFSADTLSSGVTAAREIAECGTPQAALERQAEFACSLMTRTLSEWAGLSQRSMDATKDAMMPLNARIEEATEQLFKSMAA